MNVLYSGQTRNQTQPDLQLKYEKNVKKLTADLRGAGGTSTCREAGISGEQDTEGKVSKRELEIWDWNIKEIQAKQRARN